MNDIEAIAAHHSVRSCTQETIPADIRRSLDEEIERCNREGGLDIKGVYDKPEAFSSAMAHYGSSGMCETTSCSLKTPRLNWRNAAGTTENGSFT